jgi:hypothetical protein
MKQVQTFFRCAAAVAGTLGRCVAHGIAIGCCGHYCRMGDGESPAGA